MVLQEDVNRMISLSEANKYQQQYYQYLATYIAYINWALKGIIILLFAKVILSMLGYTDGFLNTALTISILCLSLYIVVNYITMHGGLMDKSSFNFNQYKWNFTHPTKPPTFVQMDVSGVQY